MQRLGDELKMLFDRPPLAVYLRDLQGRDRFRQVGQHRESAVAVARFLEQPQLDAPQRPCRARGRVRYLHALFVQHARRGFTALARSAEGLARQIAAMLANHDETLLLQHAEHEARRAKIAIRHPQVVGTHTRQQVAHQGSFLGVGVGAQHQIGDQAQPRFVYHQRLTRQTGVEPASQGFEPMIGARQHVAIQHPHAVAWNGFVHSGGHVVQQQPQLVGTVANEGFADGRIEPSHLAVQGLIGSRDRRTVQFLVLREGREHRLPCAGSDLNQQFDHDCKGQLTFILVRGVVQEQLSQHLFVEQPFQGTTHQNP